MWSWAGVRYGHLSQNGPRSISQQQPLALTCSGFRATYPGIYHLRWQSNNPTAFTELNCYGTLFKRAGDISARFEFQISHIRIVKVLVDVRLQIAEIKKQLVKSLQNSPFINQFHLTVWIYIRHCFKSFYINNPTLKKYTNYNPHVYIIPFAAWYSVYALSWACLSRI